ncbi:ion transporter [Candidatus Woesearchaeota archaeon]|nr:ion transporter [Candidatus Woesearchaeota archaeon]HIH25587.1 hypothetical protein [Nanoarchaeota archaeon]
MKKWLHTVEVIVDKLIPFLLIILAAIIIVELTSDKLAEKYHTYIQIFDYFLITTFIIDLGFKYHRIRNIPQFIRECWLDIIAIFPFFIVFRFFEGLLGILGISEATVQAQKVLHVGVGVEKELVATVKEGSRVAEEVSRAEKLTKYIRAGARSLRLLKLKDKKVRVGVEKELTKGEKIVLGTVFYEKPEIMKRHLIVKKY